MFFWIFFVLGLAVSAVFIIRRGVDSDPYALSLKAVSSLMFVFTSAAACWYNSGNYKYSLMITCGLAACMLGDVWLDLKSIFKQNEKYFLNGGFIFFMVGHFIFASTITVANAIKGVDFLICLTAPVVVGVGVQFTPKLIGVDYTGYRVISTLYGVFLSMSFSVGFMACVRTGFAPAQVAAFSAAVLITLSDAVLCPIYFGDKKRSRPFVVANHIIYYIGQFLFALSAYLFKA